MCRSITIALTLLAATPAFAAAPTATDPEWRPVKVVRQWPWRYAPEAIIWQNKDGVRKRSDWFNQIALIEQFDPIRIHGDLNEEIQRAAEIQEPIAFVGTKNGDNFGRKDFLLWNGEASPGFDYITVNTHATEANAAFSQNPFLNGRPVCIGVDGIYVGHTTETLIVGVDVLGQDDVIEIQGVVDGHLHFVSHAE